MMRIYKPFWSYSIHKTEAWLAEMAIKGYELKRFNRVTRSFHFNSSSAKHITYKIGYDRTKLNPISSTLENDGWAFVDQQKSWYILKNERAIEEIHTTPVRSGIIRRNNLLSFLFSTIFIVITANLVFHLSLISMNLFNDGQVTIVQSPLWIITYTFWTFLLALYLLSIYSFIKLKSENKKLNNEHNVMDGLYDSCVSNSRKQEKQMKKEGKMIKHTRFGWMYSPDKLEEWLEAMEAKGYHLNRVNKLGTSFYFIKGEPRNISYCTDYQNISDENNLYMHKESGWCHIYSSYSSMQKWTIWSKEYEEDEIKPRIFTDSINRIKHAKKVASAYTLLFLPVLIIYIFILTLQLPLLNFSFSIDTLNPILYTFVLCLFSSFIIRSWLYYFRMKGDSQL
ncbi:DUF2812 domain-containing protein [Cytobacillus horneckiae]|nr:DUF2812 domain-containing protein [Cytobacillus horneckiae]MEC1154722.1 DUF2812 domain-containing protein [Cytobacillus horneckiae]